MTLKEHADNDMTSPSVVGGGVSLETLSSTSDKSKTTKLKQESQKPKAPSLSKRSPAGFLPGFDAPQVEEREKQPETSSPSNSTAEVTVTPENPLYLGGENEAVRCGKLFPTTSMSQLETAPRGLHDNLRADKARSPSGDYGQMERLDEMHEGVEDNPHTMSSAELHQQEAKSSFLPPPTPERENHQFHSLKQIQEDTAVFDDDGDRAAAETLSTTRKEEPTKPLHHSSPNTDLWRQDSRHFEPQYKSTRLVYRVCNVFFTKEDYCHATWIGFWALFQVTCANYVLSPMRDAAALQIGVAHMPKLTLASSLLAFVSSVPIGWLFEAPDPGRRKLWKKMGLTRGETQGTSLALFYRWFALSLLSYAIGFLLVDLTKKYPNLLPFASDSSYGEGVEAEATSIASAMWSWTGYFFSRLGQFMYIAFFLVVHLMKLHSLSLVWGVTTEAMEYEDVARKGLEQKQHHSFQQPKKSKTRLQRLSLVGFGGTLGGILGSVLASQLANVLHISGLLVVAAVLLEVSAELSIELGRIMQKHWEEQQLFKSSNDLAGLDSSMKRSSSLGSMKRVASGNSLYQSNMKRVASKDSVNKAGSQKSLADLAESSKHSKSTSDLSANGLVVEKEIAVTQIDENTFTQRLLRGVKTILKSRLLMAIFTYNALYASTSVLLSFQRAALVANRQASTDVSADTAFLANINIASSVAVFAFQASGIGAVIAQKCGPRGSLSLMPLIRLLGVLGLAWWHKYSGGQDPNLIIFLMLDECTRVVNLAVAKPVRESLWRGLSNEARYEAKPIVDTLANRWGAGSAAFCVSIVSKAIVWFGGTIASATDVSEPTVFGFPPVLFLCIIVAAWWTLVSADLGQIRQRIDMELKKRQ